MKINQIVCDIDKCENAAKEYSYKVKFLTEQNEGRSTEPYLSNTAKPIGLCKKHHRLFIKLTAVIGHTNYTLTEREG